MAANSVTYTSGTAGNNNNYVLQEAIGAYSDEAYTNARKLSGTGITSSNPQIDTNTETFIGQMRWLKPLNPKINIASLTDAADGEKTNYTSDFSTYIKTVRTHGAEKVNMTEVVTRQDGLAKIGRDFGETRAQDEHNAILSVLKGVAISEALVGTAGAGGQSWSNDPTDAAYGFYVDIGSATAGAGKIVSGNGKDRDNVLNYAYQGASRAEGLLDAFGKAFKDYEPDWAYLAVSPEVLASFRSANFVDETTVTEGNINFQTIFNGKFRLIVTRANQSLSASDLAVLNAGAGVDIVGTKTSFIILPGAIAMETLAVPDSTEVYRDANKYKGGGVTSVWSRWGYVLAPAGYDWNGISTAFPSDADYASYRSTSGGNTTSVVAAAGTQAALISNRAAVKGTWTRKTASALSLGILPVFHS
jgi:hypothetical protein